MRPSILTCASLIGLSFLSSPGVPQDPLIIIRAEDRTMAIDTAGIVERNGQYWTLVWTTYHQPRLDLAQRSPGPHRPVKSSAMLTGFDCDRRLMVASAFFTYDPAGRLIDSVETELRGGRVRRGEPGDSILRSVCRFGEQQRQTAADGRSIFDKLSDWVMYGPFGNNFFQIPVVIGAPIFIGILWVAARRRRGGRRK